MTHSKGSALKWFVITRKGKRCPEVDAVGDPVVFVRLTDAQHGLKWRLAYGSYEIRRAEIVVGDEVVGRPRAAQGKKRKG